MIPKVIHYCWFGGNPLPPLAEKCIASWKKYLPDYEIKEWNESNFDVNVIPYTEQAYKAKKYAFVSDYARFWILYKYGGIYFDTDVEVIRPMDDIIAAGPFMGCENNGSDMSYAHVAPGLGLGVNPGLGLGVNPGLGLYKEMLDFYATLSFRRKDGSLDKTTIVTYTTNILCKHGLKNSSEVQSVAGVNIYPVDYMCPQDYVTGEINITDRTVSIHHYSGSWKTPKDKLKSRIASLLGDRVTGVLIKLRRHIKIDF